MSSVTNEYQRLQEISPLLPDNISKTILWNKKKIIKQGMNVPVSLRSIQPTSWWDDKHNDLTHTSNIFDDEDENGNKKDKKNKKKKKDKKKEDGEEEESVTIELTEVEEEENRIVTRNETRV